MIKRVLWDFVSFLKHPKDVQTKESLKRKLQTIFILLGFEMCVVCFVLMPLNYLVEHFVSTDSKHDFDKKSITSVIFFAVVLAPVLEEIGFRLILRRIFPIKYIFSQKLWDRIFPFLVYASSVIFGFVHLTNYTNDGFWFYIFSPIIIASQLIGGFIITFIRVKYNFFYGILYHSLWNASLIFLFIFIDHFSSPYQEKTEKYSIEISEKHFFDEDEKQVFKIDSLQGKIYKIEVEQYSFQHFLDSLYQGNKYQINDAFIKMKFDSQKGVTKEEFIEILKKEYDIESNAAQYQP
ncbi:MAG: CPBP family intramembrane metalloprotease [Riemerella sp.]|nr:CPBP family intramembrane metalloprotease [Riemerella sp.]